MLKRIIKVFYKIFFNKRKRKKLEVYEFNKKDYKFLYWN